MATAVTNQIDFKLDDPSILELVSARPALKATPHGLALDGASLRRLAERTGTPVYAYGLDTIGRRFDRLRAAFDVRGVNPLIAYAVKANDTGGILACLARRGAGADVVSEGELVRAVRSGIKAKDIVFSGVGKRRDELGLALGLGIRQVNIESRAELEMLSDVARQMNVTAAFAVRVNPDVDAGTHAKITTGRVDSKFGISQRDATMLARGGTTLSNVQFIGLSVHIGSQITDIAPFRAAFRAVAAMARAILAEGHDLRSLDLGGGIGISYRPSPSVSVESYADAVVSELGELTGNVDIVIEPGRWIVGPSGVLVTRVILEKENDGRRFVVVDAGMNDLIRPAMYGAWHGIVPVDTATNTGRFTAADVVGPVCESSDTFGRSRLLPRFSAGDLVAILDAGAYGSVMSSSYNNRPAAAIALASRGKWVIARQRQSLDELMASDLSIPLPVRQAV